MAISVVLEPFGWYPDGITREALEIGDIRDFGSNTDGMRAAKMIGEMSVKAEAPAVATQPAPEPVAQPAKLPSSPDQESAVGEPPVEPAVAVDPDPALPRRRARK